MPIEANIKTQQDRQAVEAVKRGDAERYRELVERYERRVYAVAWSRLGDVTLAEEATQEAFIRGYRYLKLLGEGEKFAAWITSIARNIAINLGIRHRRELNKRERWALEQADAGTSQPTDNTYEQYLPGNLRLALAGLPDAQRECLVLFYFEGKSGTEAAGALGISEAAFRVRLHRARAALRERLEEHLGESLEQIRPSHPITPAVMGVVLSSSTTKTATGVGIGAKVLSVLGKTSLFWWLIPFSPLIGILPMWWIGKADRRNYREADGFRARLHRSFSRTLLLGFPLMVVLIIMLQHSAHVAWGTNGVYLATGSFLLLGILISARSLIINRNRFQVVMFVYVAVIAAGVFMRWVGWIPPRLAQLPLLFATVLFLLVWKQRPLRMDYNLLLRAAQDLLKCPDGMEAVAQSYRFDRRSLLAFARFLGSRWLVVNFRWETQGLMLRLSPVKARFLTNMASAFIPLVSRRCSHIVLGWDGAIIAHCGQRDATDLAALHANIFANPQELEALVAKAVAGAWQEFRAGNLATSERALGQVPDSEVFIVPVAKSAATRWLRRIMFGWVAISLALLTLVAMHPPWLQGLKPVRVTETEVRAFLSNVTTNPNPIINNTQRGYLMDPANALYSCLILPSTNLFTVTSLRTLHEVILSDTGFNLNKEKRRRLSQFQHACLMHKAMEGGWISWDDLGFKSQDATEYFQHLKTNEWQFMLVHGESWSWVKSQRFKVERIHDLSLNQLRWLRDVDCLDLVNREKLIQQIASVQTLSGTPPGQPPIHDWQDVSGLFFTPCWPALQDTYFSLAALEILGGLDKIDREACIVGILKQHRGKGFFTSPDSGSYNEYHIRGDARDTFCAFESLRILGALDRVKDLDRWRFRPDHGWSPWGNNPKGMNWNDVEAWVCRQRFERFLRERKDNPHALPHSLLEP